MTNEETIVQLEDTLRKLKTQYDLFFAGARKVPPNVERKKFDILMREMAGEHIRDNALRFRFTSIVSKYNRFIELWGRQMREREEGPLEYQRRKEALSRPVEEAATSDSPPSRPAATPVTSDTADSYVRLARSENGAAIQQLHMQIAAAQKELGKENAMTVEQVAAMVTKQAEALRERYRVETIAFRVETVDGKVKLKAKPIQG